MFTIDIECYRDYFLIFLKEIGCSKTVYLEILPNRPITAEQADTLNHILETNTTVSFNGLSYDLPIIQAALEGFDNESLFNLSTKIIKSNLPAWTICKQNNIVVPLDKWDHIDLIEVAPGNSSLKLYGARMNAPKLQDLPIKPDQSIPYDMYETLRLYCRNDVETTELLYNTLKPQIDLRVSMSEQYGMDLRSKSDAQIAETIIKSELEKKTGRKYTPLKLKDGATIKYQDPKIISFRSHTLQNIFQKILDTDFSFAPNGSIKMPDWMKKENVEIAGRKYNLGIGGLHSCEKGQLINREKEMILADHDVSSFYPNIVLQQQLSPKSMGKDFIELYKSIVERRLKAKANKDTVTANTLKIVLNSSYGKLGSKFSPLYSPQLLLQVTITGQLCLLMLIERMEAAGIQIMSANTDGIVCYAPVAKERDMELVAWEWMLDTSFNLERSDYTVLASRDVNNYFAIKPEGKVKRKGCFANGGLSKNPDRNIIYTAVINFIKDGTRIEQTIRECNDITQFLTARKVTGGATWNGEELGKSIRFYSSTSTTFIDSCIHYTLNGNRVSGSGGCRPMMELPEEFPRDLNYGAYLADAEKLLKEVGYVGA